MGKLYERVNWENAPSTKTPISAANLNKMDNGIGDLDDKLVEQEIKMESLSSRVEQIANNQIPEEYLKASVDDYIDEKGAGLATDEDLTVLDTKIDEVNSSLSGEIDGEAKRAQAKENELEELFSLPTEEAVSKWLDEHPESTTTVQDKSLNIDKMVVGTLGYVTPQMFGAKGDGVTDDTLAIKNALNSGLPIYIPVGSYCVSDTLQLPDNTVITGKSHLSKNSNSVNGSSIIKFTNDLTYGIILGKLCKIQDFVVDCANNLIDYAIITKQDVNEEGNCSLERINIFNNPNGIGFYIGQIHYENYGRGNILKECVARYCYKGFDIYNSDNHLISCQSDACSIGATCAQNQNTFNTCLFFNSKIQNLRFINCSECVVMSGSCDNYIISSSNIESSLYILNSKYITFYAMRVLGGTNANVKISNSNNITFNNMIHIIEESNKPNYLYICDETCERVISINPTNNLNPTVDINLGVTVITYADIYNTIKEDNIKCVGFGVVDFDKCADNTVIQIGSENCLNTPNGLSSWYGLCMTFKGSAGSYKSQIAISVFGEFSVRSYDGNTWSDWSTNKSESAS